MFFKSFGLCCLPLLILIGMYSCTGLPEEIPLEEIPVELKFGILSIDIDDSYTEELFKETKEGQIWTYRKDGDAFMIHLYCGANDSLYSASEIKSLSMWDSYFSLSTRPTDPISKQEYTVNGYKGRLVTYTNKPSNNYMELCFDNLGSKNYYIMITGNRIKDSTLKDIMKAIKTMTIKCD